MKHSIRMFLSLSLNINEVNASESLCIEHKRSTSSKVHSLECSFTTRLFSFATLDDDGLARHEQQTASIKSVRQTQRAITRICIASSSKVTLIPYALSSPL